MYIKIIIILRCYTFFFSFIFFIILIINNIKNINIFQSTKILNILIFKINIFLNFYNIKIIINIKIIFHQFLNNIKDNIPPIFFFHNKIIPI